MLLRKLIWPDDPDTEREPVRTRLQVGMIVVYDNVKWRVGLVNYSRARLDPIGRVKRKVTRRDGQEVEMMVTLGSVSISPDSTIPILKYAKTKKKT
jgi:hypothetical protein